MTHPQKPEKGIRTSLCSVTTYSDTWRNIKYFCTNLGPYSFTKGSAMGSRFPHMFLGKTIFPEAILACAWLT